MQRQVVSQFEFDGIYNFQIVGSYSRSRGIRSNRPALYLATTARVMRSANIGGRKPYDHVPDGVGIIPGSSQSTRFASLVMTHDRSTSRPRYAFTFGGISMPSSGPSGSSWVIPHTIARRGPPALRRNGDHKRARTILFALFSVFLFFPEPEIVVANDQSPLRIGLRHSIPLACLAQDQCG